MRSSIADSWALSSQLGEHPVVAGDAEQAEPDDEQAGDRAGAEGDVERGLEALLGGLGGAHVRAHGDVHADEARPPPRAMAPIRKPNAVPQPSSL